MRISFARASASMRWLSERSGAVEVLFDVPVDVVSVAVAMGGESTHRQRPIKKIDRIHLHLDLSLRYVEVAGRWRGLFAGVFGLCQIARAGGRAGAGRPCRRSSPHRAD
jgi:hypothetical protein